MKMKKKYGALYEDLKLTSGKKVLSIPGFFLLRRLMIALAICNVGDILIWQYVLLASQVIIQVNILGMGVFKDISRTKIELFNECILMFSIYTIICFTPFIPDVDCKFYIGYATISIVIAHLFVNLCIILKSTYLAIKFKLKLRSKRRILEK